MSAAVDPANPLASTMLEATPEPPHLGGAFGMLILVALICVGSMYLLATGWRDGFVGNGREILAYVLSFIFGAAVGATELVARYRDRPQAAICTSPAVLYMAINGLASLVAFWCLYTGRLDIDVNIFGPRHPALNDLLLGGFGAMALFRTSVFNVRVGETSVAVGPAAVLQVILRAADRETDRLRAGPRAARVGAIMRGIVYDRARDALPLHCFALMQNLTLEEQNALEQALAVLDRKQSMGDEAKAYSLGLLLMNLVGEDVLQRAANGLGDRIKGPPPDRPAVLSRAKDLVLDDLPALLATCLALANLSSTAADQAVFQTMIKPPDAVVQGSDKVLIALARLRARFGPEIVSEAVTAMLNARSATTRLSLDDLKPTQK